MTEKLINIEFAQAAIKDVLGMTETLIRIDVPYAVFGLIAKDDVIIEAAPIAAWAVGKLPSFVEACFKRCFVAGCQIQHLP